MVPKILTSLIPWILIGPKGMNDAIEKWIDISVTNICQIVMSSIKSKSQIINEIVFTYNPTYQRSIETSFFVGLALYVDLESAGKKWAISYIFMKINVDTSCNKLIITETEITNFIYKKKETIILFISLLKWISQYVWLTLNLGSSCNKLIIIETEITNFIYIKSRKQ